VDDTTALLDFILFLEFRSMCGRSKKLSGNFNKLGSNEKLQLSNTLAAAPGAFWRTSHSAQEIHQVVVV
jgi:hypothetical protein